MDVGIALSTNCMMVELMYIILVERIIVPLKVIL